MGAQGSKTSERPSAEGSQALSYYEILQVDEDASQDDIRKSFRKLALVHHPDKNPNDIEAATQRFATMQQAYEVLSDEQERAWYDSHRAALQPEPDAAEVFEDIKRGVPGSRRRLNDPGLSVRHLMKFFDASIWKSMDDSSNGFFTIYRNLFDRLSAEESTWEGGGSSYPGFGDASWPWIADKSQEGPGSARSFYNTWSSFSTAKDFAWKERWNIAEAPERQARRLMEKDNKKAREEARKEYNETVRSLVMFIRKRDSRYKAHLVQQSRNASSNASGKVASSSNAAVEAAKKRAEAGELYVEQDWQRSARIAGNAQLAHDEWGDGQWEEAEGEEFECVACGKSFRSEQAWGNHERSRKHLKEVEKLKREMRKESEALNLTNEGDGIPEGTISEDEAETVLRRVDETAEDTIPEPTQATTPSGYLHDEAKAQVSRPEVIPTSPSVGASEPLDARETRSGSITPNPATEQDIAEHPLSTAELSKKEKRRQREAAKREAEAAQQSEGVEKCNVCNEIFESRTRLFAHIRETGHALAEPSDGRRQTGKARKGGQEARAKGSKKGRG